MFSLWVSRMTDTGGITLTVPGQESHHCGDSADKVEHGVGHLALEDPVRVGWGVAGDASGTVGKCHNEIQRNAAHHGHPVNDRLQDRCSNKIYKYQCLCFYCTVLHCRLAFQCRLTQTF